MTTQTPPLASGGLPVIGHALEMMRDRETLFRRGYQEHGDVFAIRLGPQYAAVVSGPEHNKQFYTQTDKTLNMQDAYTFLKEAIGEVLFTAGQDTYYNQRPVLQEVFRRERMNAYVQAMNVEVQRWLDTLGESGEVDLVPEMLRLTQYVAGRALIGDDYEEELGKDFWKKYGAISQSLDPILPPTLPLPKFRRRDRAKQEIKQTFQEMIAKRRRSPEKYDDLISTLLTTPLKDGSTMPDQTIVDMFTGLLFAGHETTAGQAAWTLAQLLQHPDYLEKVEAELEEKLAEGQEVTQEIIKDLELIGWAIEETTRMRPSADVQMRTAEDALQFGAYQVPAGWRVIVNAANSHFLPEIFSNPQAYDPLRFSAARGEGKNPFAIVGFGGGIHKCTGMNFAKNEMTVITALLLQQYNLVLLSKEIRVVSGNGANHPSSVRVAYREK